MSLDPLARLRELLSVGVALTCFCCGWELELDELGGAGKVVGRLDAVRFLRYEVHIPPEAILTRMQLVRTGGRMKMQEIDIVHFLAE